MSNKIPFQKTELSQLWSGQKTELSQLWSGKWLSANHSNQTKHPSPVECRTTKPMLINEYITTKLQQLQTKDNSFRQKTTFSELQQLDNFDSIVITSSNSTRSSSTSKKWAYNYKLWRSKTVTQNNNYKRHQFQQLQQFGRTILLKE